VQSFVGGGNIFNTPYPFNLGDIAVLRTFFVTVAVAFILLSAGPVGAMTIRNTTTNTDLFIDDYEGVPSAGGPADDDPVAALGTWVITEPGDDNVQVLADPAAPQAAQGKKFLKTADAPGPLQVVNPQATFAPQSTAGDVIHWGVHGVRA